MELIITNRSRAYPNGQMQKHQVKDVEKEMNQCSVLKVQKPSQVFCKCHLEAEPLDDAALPLMCLLKFLLR